MIKQDNIPAALENTVWNLYIGINNITPYCFCCKLEPITRANFHCGYVVAKKNNGSMRISNLRPICGLCNSSLGTKNMINFMKKYGFDSIQSPKGLPRNNHNYQQYNYQQ